MSPPVGFYKGRVNSLSLGSARLRTWTEFLRSTGRKAAHYFQQAIAKDPGFAAALAGLADCLSALGCYSIVAPVDGCGKAKLLALQALEMDRSLAEPHTSIAWVAMWYDYDFKAAERGFERAIELNPRYATAHSQFGFCLGVMGRSKRLLPGSNGRSAWTR